jgi:hypothetical protein
MTELKEESPMSRRLALELTFRRVELLDELVYFVERCVSRLDALYGGRGRCSVIVGPVFLEGGGMAYETRVRLVGTDGVAEVRCEDRDLFRAVEDAFTIVSQRVRRGRREGHLASTRDVDSLHEVGKQRAV